MRAFLLLVLFLCASSSYACCTAPAASTYPRAVGSSETDQPVTALDPAAPHRRAEEMGLTAGIVAVIAFLLWLNFFRHSAKRKYVCGYEYESLSERLGGRGYYKAMDRALGVEPPRS